LTIPKNAESYAENENQAFLLGERVGEPQSPVYPPELVGSHLPPQSVCVEFDIDETGNVVAARPLLGQSDDDDCPIQNRQPDTRFFIEARKAVLLWKFEPARMCTYPTGTKADQGCEGENVTVERVPIRLAYHFDFTSGSAGSQVKASALSADRAK